MILGFSCYLHGSQSLMIKLTNCWDLSYARNDAKSFWPKDEQNFPELRLIGNVYCGHRIRSHAIVHMFESMSLYSYYNNSRGEIYNELLLGRPLIRQNNVLMESNNIGEWVRSTGRDPKTGKRFRITN